MAPLNDRQRNTQPAQQSLFPDAPASKRRVRLRLPRTPQLRPRRTALWMAVDLPDLPLLVFLRGQQVDNPQAVIETRGTSATVIAVNDLAADAAVQPGMTLAAAWAMAPALEIHQRDEYREQQLLRRLAWWAHRYTPQVALDTDGLLLEVRASLRLFGGVLAMRRAVEQGFREMKIPVRLGMAPTARAARWLVRAGYEESVEQLDSLAGRLGELPLACTDFPPRLCERLAGMGLRRVADVLRLPRDGFARRCGPQALEILDQALGRIPDIRAIVSLPPRFCSKLEFLYEISDASVLLHPAEHLLRELEAWLRASQQGVRRLQVDIILRSGEIRSLRLGFLDALRDAGRMRSLLEQQLERVTLVEPARALQLEVMELEGFAGQARQLFREDRKHADARELVEILRARLGHAAVSSLEALADHRPEASWARSEPGAAETGKPGHADTHLQPARRPAWLLPQPQRLAVRRVRNQDCPLYEGELRLLDGPERIETGWWDGADVRRDYYRACNAAGMELWIFHDRRAGNWWLHGFFA